MRRNSAGFTMVELIVTMVVLGILAVTVLPRMDALQGFDEIGFRDQVKATLEYARKSAVAGRRWVCASIADGDGDGRSELAISRDAADPGARTAATVNCTIALTLPGTSTNSVEAPAAVTVFSGPALVFDALGRPWTSASSSVSTAASYTLTGGSTATVIVEAETGYVHH